MSDAPDVTELLMAWSAGSRDALDQMIPLVEDQLRRLAHHYMRGERAGHSLQTTALINEAYLRLVDVRRVQWQDRAHFFAMCARVMRRILVDIARHHRSLKRAGIGREVPPNTAHHGSREDLIALDEALEALGTVDPRKAQVVELRFFGGLTVEETAEALDVSVDTVMRDWKVSRTWLLRHLASLDDHAT